MLREAVELDLQLPSGRLHAQRFGAPSAPLAVCVPGRRLLRLARSTRSALRVARCALRVARSRSLFLAAGWRSRYSVPKGGTPLRIPESRRASPRDKSGGGA
jgi:hypothetical protein